MLDRLLSGALSSPDVDEDSDDRDDDGGGLYHFVKDDVKGVKEPP